MSSLCHRNHPIFAPLRRSSLQQIQHQDQADTSSASTQQTTVSQAPESGPEAGDSVTHTGEGAEALLAAASTSAVFTTSVELGQSTRKRRSKDEPPRRKQVGKKANVTCKGFAQYFAYDLFEHTSIPARLRLDCLPEPGWAEARVLDVMGLLTLMVGFDR